MNIIRAVLVCLYLLIIAPYLVGGVFYGRKESGLKNSYVYRYLRGFLFEIGIWWIVACPFLVFFKSKPFHVLCYVYLVMLGVFSIAGFIETVLEWQRMESDFGFPNKLLCVCILVFFTIFCVQIIRTIVPNEFEYSDETNFIPLINDTLYMDRAFAKDELTGVPLENPRSKRAIGNWVFFVAFVAYTSGLHASFLCKVVFPAFVIMVFYSMTYLFGRWMLKDNRTHIGLFCAITVCIIEAFWGINYNFYYIAYPVMWGKVILSILPVPYIYMHMFDLFYKEKTRNTDVLSSFLLGCSAISFSTGAFILVPIEIMFFIVLSWTKGRKDYWFYLSILACGIPIAIGMVLLFIYL